MGYYNVYLRRMGWTKADLVREAGLLAVSVFAWTESKLPPMDPSTVGKMRLKGVPGLNIVRKEYMPARVKTDKQASTSNNVHAG